MRFPAAKRGSHLPAATRLRPPRLPLGSGGDTGGQRGARAGGRGFPGAAAAGAAHGRTPRARSGCSGGGRGGARLTSAGRQEGGRGPAGGQRPPPLGRVQRGRAAGLRAAPAGASRQGDTGSAEPREFAISANCALKTSRVLEVYCPTCDKAPRKAFTPRCRSSEPVSLGLAPASLVQKERKGQRALGADIHRMWRPHPFPFWPALRYQPAHFAAQINSLFHIVFLLSDDMQKVQ